MRVAAGDGPLPAPRLGRQGRGATTLAGEPRIAAALRWLCPCPAGGGSRVGEGGSPGSRSHPRAPALGTNLKGAEVSCPAPCWTLACL